MVGHSAVDMLYICALCTGSFPTRACYNEHIKTHDDQATPQLPCPVCPFKFPDSNALAVHMSQTGHRAENFKCKCGKVFQTQVMYNQHTKFPSPCYEDTSPNRRRAAAANQASQPAQLKVPDVGSRGGYVDRDAPTSVGGPSELLYGGASTPTNVSGPWCHVCEKEFASEALMAAHHLRCKVNSERAVEKVAQEQSSGLPDVTTTLTAAPKKLSTEAARPQRSDLGGKEVAPSFPKAPLPKASLQNLQSSKVPCGIFGCNKSFRSVSAAQQHREATHDGGSLASSAAPTKPAAPATLSCGVDGCKKTFRSAAGLKQHKQDSHGVGGKKLDLYGKDSWQLSQASRTQLRAAGTPLPGPPSKNTQRPPTTVGRGPIPTTMREPARQTPAFAPQPSRNQLPTQVPQNSPRPPTTAGHGPVPITMRETGRLTPAFPPEPPRQTVAFPSQPPCQTPAVAPQPSRDHFPTQVPLNQASQRDHVMSGQADIDQAVQLHENTMRLLITADIAISYEGKIHYGGIAYLRIGVARQEDAAGMLDELVHLPKKLQAKYHMLHSNTFGEGFKHARYPVMEHTHLPEPREDAPRLKVIVISCSKVLLANGCEEVVKIAAIDVLTGQILMDFLVCTDPKQEVKDWRPDTTGLTCFKDFEILRSQKYKVLKGWKSARAALTKYADRNTILIGHNIRVDQDALGIVHGRAIDVVILMEKAANGGALSKAQLRIESLMRDLPKIMLKPITRHGRDVLQDAFAIRELLLWYVKNKDTAISYMKKKTLEYQRVL